MSVSPIVKLELRVIHPNLVPIAQLHVNTKMLSYQSNTE